MSSHFEAIALRAGQPFSFRLLVVQLDECRNEELIREANALGCFADINEVTCCEGDFEPAVTAAQRLAARRYNECLVLAFDLGENAGTSEIEAILDAAPPGTEPWGSQSIAYIVAGGDARISFSTLNRCINLGVAGAGNGDDFLTAIEKWCGRAGEPVIRVPCLQTPSWRLRCIGHDYLVKVGPILDKIEQPTIVNAQSEIDFWQTTLKNVLVFPWEHRPGGSLGDGSVPPTVPDRCNKARTQLLVPSHLGPLSEKTPLPDGVSFSTYDAVESLPERCLGDEVSSIFFCPPDELAAIDELANRGFSPDAKVVLDPGDFRLGWRDWQNAFSRNCLGAFQVGAVFGSLNDSGGRTRNETTMVNTKLGYWQTLAVVPLAEATDRLVELMSESYLYLAEAAEGIVSTDRLALLCRAVAQVHSSKSLYFGDTEDN